MVFSSLFFLLYFLPVVLLLYWIIPDKGKNLFLLLASLYFYAWGEGLYVFLMLFVVLVNYIIGRLLEKIPRRKKTLLAIGIFLNLVPLLFYKYSTFLLSVFNIEIASTIHLPIGISFFTFQALSYLIDTYRQTTAAQQNIINLGLYIALFPQLIAGPIVRYHDVAKQIVSRKVTLSSFNYGVERFILGLGKKVLLANPLGMIADITYTLPQAEISTGEAWLGAFCYMLQIFYDFSGYSDMAIGLGHMFGFKFLENFNFPYTSRSIQEFWRRWHISLSNWFRDYLYIPLGGNRISSTRTVFNLFSVFFLCGLWHGASWNFIVWGLFHGSFLALERTRFGKFIHGMPKLLQHTYVVLVVLVGWVFFRAETLDQALEFLRIMAGTGAQTGIHPYLVYKLDTLFFITLSAAVFCLFPLAGKILPQSISVRKTTLTDILSHGFKILLMSSILLLSIAALATDTYNPFIYFRF